MIALNFTEPLFHYNVNVLIGDSTEIQNYNCIDTELRKCLLTCMKNDKDCGTIVFKGSHQTREVLIYSNNNVALINRQIFNAVMVVLDKEGIQYTNNISNIFASLVEFYTNSIFDKIVEYLESDPLKITNENNTYLLSLKSE